MTELIKTAGLTKTYKNGRGIEDMSLSIEEGAVFGLLGPNGSGKTTLMKVMTGLLHAQGGEVSIFGLDPAADAPAILAKTGCIIEAPGLYPYLTARQNLTMMKRFYPDAPGEWGGTLLRKLEMEPYLNEKVSAFSMGMKQRLAFAMALYAKPELLVLDEPTNGMDISGTALVRSVLKDYTEWGGTILISSHLAHEIELICSHVAVMDHGRVLETARVDRLLKEHSSVEDYYLAVVKREKGGVV